METHAGLPQPGITQLGFKGQYEENESDQEDQEESLP